jgi:diguanylate cyclase (GGDEF)-like protein
MTAHPLSALLASALPRALSSERESVYEGIHATGNEHPLRVRVRPLPEVLQQLRLLLVVIEQVTPNRAQRASVEIVPVSEHAERTLAELQTELTRNKETLQAIVEELETSNEELQATNEELLSSNEELQSTNEELQSVNEELHSVNAERAQKIVQLRELNGDMDNLLRSTNIGTLFLDATLNVRKFTPSVANYIPLLERDIGRPLEHLALHFGGNDFLDDVRSVLRSGRVFERPFATRDGHSIVRILPYVDRSGVVSGAVVTFIDVTEVKRATEMTQNVVDSLPEHVALLDKSGNILMVNESWKRFADDNGGSREGIVGSNYFAVCEVATGQVSDFVAGIKSVLRGDQPSFQLEYPCDSATEVRWFLMHAAPAIPGERVVVSHVDVTERKLAEIALQNLAMNDPLTHLLNRRGFERQLSIEMDRARRSGSGCCAIMIDCDDFKKINDALGHAGGDVVLATLAKRLQATLRPADVLARIGGDEFLVLLPETRMAEAAYIAERLRLAAGAEPMALSHGPVSMTISASVAPVSLAVASLEEVLSMARVALQTAKIQGRNRVFLDSGSKPRAGRPASIRDALSHGTFFRSVGQTIVELQTRKIVGVEYLTRGPTGSLHTPVDFFRIAIQEGLLTSIDLQCFKSCIAESSHAASGLWRHVNLYPSTLLDTPPGRLATLLPNDVAPSTYCVELSEQQILGDPAYMLEHVRALRKSGVRIAIDDVGFGRTSLESLIVLEPEVVKIDRTYVDGVAKSPQKQRALERLVNVAKTLNALIVAEGVENAADLATLVEMGVLYAQGFLFDHPDKSPLSTSPTN